MTGMDELRKRVEAAEQQFGLITSQSRKYSDRLTQLVGQMEATHAEQRREIAALNARLGQYEQENGHLKAMLMGLLQAVEDGSHSVIGQTVRDMEDRIGRLVGHGHELGPAAAAGPMADEPVESVIAGDEPAAEAVMAEEVAVAGQIGAGTPEEDAVLDDLDAAMWDDADEPAVADIRAAPVPETVALDDEPEEEDELTDSANNLLDRVEAAANALLSGSDLESADSDLTEEISALLESAIHGAAEASDETAAKEEAEDAEETMTAFPGDEIDTAMALAAGEEDVKARTAAAA